MKWNFLNLVKNICKMPTANIVLIGGKWTIPYKTENKTRFVSHTPINVVLESLTLCNRTRKKKGHTDGEEKHTVFVYTHV